MMKSKNILNDEVLNEAIEKMKRGDKETILDGVSSSVPLLVLDSVIYGGKYKVKDLSYIERLKEHLHNSNMTFFGTPLSSFVKATLDVLDVQPYEGTDQYIKNWIDTLR